MVNCKRPRLLTGQGDVRNLQRIISNRQLHVLLLYYLTYIRGSVVSLMQHLLTLRTMGRIVHGRNGTNGKS